MAPNQWNKSQDRRAFVRTAGLSAGAAVTGGLAFLQACGGETTAVVEPSPDLRLARGPRTPVAKNSLKTAASMGITGTLTAAASAVDLGDGRAASALAYNGGLPGPTVRVRNGDNVSLTLQNAMAEDTTIHWHGMLIPPDMDGQPTRPVAAGASLEYRFPVIQRSCFNWYHPHPHGLTGKQVALGLAGGFIINDIEEDALNLPAGNYEVPLILRDVALNSTGNLTYTAKSSGFFGTTALANGTRDATLAVDRAKYRFRVLNGSNARVFRLALSNGGAFTLIGNDGGLLPTSSVLQEILISPAERLDVVVDFSGLAAGTKLTLRCQDAGWDLLEFVVGSTVVSTGAVPSSLSSITPLPAPQRTREFSFDGMSRINGKVYNMSRDDFTVPFGETELWRFRTAGNAPHPVHLHGNSFQVFNRSGGRGVILPWERGWKDTVLLLDGETVDVLVRFDTYPGRYMLHCHKLEHEDMGMMTQFQVV